ncbi:MAG TPA: MarR family winged helix-turn-helix transcriptional regulator [Thermodesulfobacteriota bacterium]|nr:MarR family winged helix-turn-helix transcriptional regulator [Thermodesulfobacteriota bacterium]
MKRKPESKKGNGHPKFENLKLAECLDCVCYEFRKTARFVINYYDTALKDADLKSNQFIILVSVGYLESPNFKKLAEFVGIDQSTLARNLTTVEKQKLVSVRAGKNRREKLISLTKKGERKLVSSFPLWKKAQGRLVDGLGTDNWKNIQKELTDVVSITKSLN